jgi:hypothetical protein
MGGVPTGIRLEAVLGLCKIYGYDKNMMELILFFDAVAYPLRYPPKK